MALTLDDEGVYALKKYAVILYCTLITFTRPGPSGRGVVCEMKTFGEIDEDR